MMCVSAKKALCLVVLFSLLHQTDGQTISELQATHVDIPEHMKEYVTSLVSALERKYSADIGELTNELEEQRSDILKLTKKLEEQEKTFDAKLAKFKRASEKEKKKNAKRTKNLQNRLLDRVVFKEEIDYSTTDDQIYHQGCKYIR